MPEPVSIQVGGNVDGSIVVGDHNFVVNSNHGTIIYQQAGPLVQARTFVPQPPRMPRGFINRTVELAKLESWITANEIVLLHGPDGMGKSALLRQAANSIAARAMPGGVVLLESVDVDGQVLGPNDVIQRLFDALFESNPPLKVDAVTARTYLSNTRPLILMDEVGLSPALQKALPNLFPAGAILMAADTASGTDAQHLSIGPLPDSEALALLANRAELTLNSSNRAVLEQICDLLGDVSLALVITGNVLRETHTSPGAALQAIEAIDVPERDPALAALSRAFGFAFSRLSLSEQETLSAAALTPGVSMAPEWLSAALGDVDVDVAIERLKAFGLLFANSPRLRMPPGFVAPAQRASLLDKDALMERLIVFLRAPLKENPHNWDYLQNELGNFFGALLWAAQKGRTADVIALGGALDAYLTLHGLWDAWGVSLNFILEAARQGGQRAVEAWALHQLGTRAVGTGATQQALDLLHQALELRRIMNDTEGMAYTQHNINLLIAPPPLPEKPKAPTPKPPKPADGGTNFFLLLNGLGLVGFLILLMTLLAAWFFIPRSGRTPTPSGTPILATSTIVILPTITVTPTVTQTPTVTLTPTLTATPTPTSLGSRSGEIVFETGADDPIRIDLLDTDRTEIVNLLEDASDPAWSPDGQRLAYVAYATATGSNPANIAYHAQEAPRIRQIYVQDFANNTITQITHTRFNKSHPTWSPDGKKLAFVSQNGRRSSSDIYVIDSDGNDQSLQNLTVDSDGTGQYAYPEWSPQGGEYIAYQEYVDNDHWEIRVGVLGTDSTNTLKLASLPFETGEPIPGEQPSWSPDGKRIAFAYNNRLDTPWTLYVMDRDGNNLRSLLEGKSDNTFPDWSPDGHWIAFSSAQNGSTPQIYIVDLTNLVLQRLTSDENYVSEPDWRP